MTLFARLRAHAREAPSRVAIDGADTQLSYATLLTEVEATAERLTAERVRVLAIDLDNGPAWAVLDLAALYLGITVVPLPAFFSPTQARHALESAGVDAIASADARTLSGRLGEGLAAIPPLHVGGADVALLRPVRGARSAPSPIPPGVHKITFTSGTTGDPKGVMLNRTQIEAVVGSLAAAVGMMPRDRHIALLPLSVLLENIAGIYLPLWSGATAQLWPLRQVGLSGSSRLDRGSLVAALCGSAATTAVFTPQTLQGLVEAVEQGARTPSTLRFAAVGGAPVSPRLLERATALGLPVYEGYGLSECSSVICLNTPGHHRPGSVGRPLPHLVVRIDDGEVVVAGQSFCGYLGGPPATADDWHSGDLGELDADGFLYLHGRRRNVFITAFGHNVAPEWVERELMLEPAIAQAAVFGEARPRNVAVIVPALGVTADDIELALARVNRELPDYARVSGWIAAEGPFTPANGQLTGTGRVRRDVVAAHHAGAIDALYREVHVS